MFKRSCGFYSLLSANWLSAESALPAGSHAQANVGKLKVIGLIVFKSTPASDCIFKCVLFHLCQFRTS